MNNVPSVAPERILLVDDRPANLLVYRTILEELGQTLMTANSGEEALKLVLKHEFAVILLDVNMPTMNGFDTAALIRNRRKSAGTPIIFLTAFTDEVNVIQGYESGAVDFMPTPVIPEVLKAKVRVFIELSQMRRQAALQAEERARREAAEEAARTAAFLSQASEALTRAQTRADCVRTLTTLAVPQIADSAFVWFAHDEFPATQDWISAEADDPRAPQQIDRLRPLIDKVMAGARPHSLVADEGRHVQILPLTVQGDVPGVLILSGGDPGATSQALAQDLAARAAIALENILLMERIREADRRKDEFLGMLAHELRNPLGPIYNCLQLQKMMAPDDPRVAAIRDTLDRQVRHMSRLIDDLLDATRLAHGKILLRKEHSDLTAIICQTAGDYRNIMDGGGVTLTIDVPDRPVWVDGDPTRLLQVVGNLLHNANKFSNPGGQVRVRLSEDEGQVRLSVMDNGIGIEPAILGCVFDVFRQADQGLDRSRGGLGLGLALVKGLVELHDGQVEAFSAGPGQGAEFRITLPVAAERPVIAAPQVLSVAGQSTLNILLIEDNVDAAQSARWLLDHHGHSVDIAHDAEDGLAKARRLLPDVILCDIGLPGMDGYQVIRAIRDDSQLASVFAVALTGYGREADRNHALTSGFDAHMTKPVDWPVLMAMLVNARPDLIATDAVA